MKADACRDPFDQGPWASLLQVARWGWRMRLPRWHPCYQVVILRGGHGVAVLACRGAAGLCQWGGGLPPRPCPGGLLSPLRGSRAQAGRGRRVPRSWPGNHRSPCQGQDTGWKTRGPPELPPYMTICPPARFLAGYICPLPDASWGKRCRVAGIRTLYSGWGGRLDSR